MKWYQDVTIAETVYILRKLNRILHYTYNSCIIGLRNAACVVLMKTTGFVFIS